MLRQRWEEKNSSHRRTGSSQIPTGNGSGVGVQGASELQTEKVVVIKVRNPYGLGLHDPRRSLQTVGGTDRSAGNLQGKQCRFWQRTANNHQSTPGRDIDGGGKLQGFLAIPVTGADKNRNSELQSWPLTFFLL